MAHIVQMQIKNFNFNGLYRRKFSIAKSNFPEHE